MELKAMANKRKKEVVITSMKRRPRRVDRHLEYQQTHTMSTGSLKLQLIERLLRTQDEGLLKVMADLFRAEKGVEDEDGLTDEHCNIVKERYAE